MNRRELLISLGSAAALALGASVFPLDPRKHDPHRIALLSDPHIDGDPKAVERQVNMFDHLRDVVAEVVGLETLPATCFINGDCAHSIGKPEDYILVNKLIEPIRQEGISVNISLGNHDQREHFWTAMTCDATTVRAVPERQVGIVELERANWFVLDTLADLGGVLGELGDVQRAWLAKALDARPDKPAIVMLHHNPVANTINVGLKDAKELLEVLLPRKQVKAVIFGHTHDWSITKREGLHLINLPAVGYVFVAKKPSGWVDCHLGADRANFELRCLDKKHPQHGQSVELAWR